MAKKKSPKKKVTKTSKTETEAPFWKKSKFWMIVVGVLVVLGIMGKLNKQEKELDRLQKKLEKQKSFGQDTLIEDAEVVADRDNPGRFSVILTQEQINTQLQEQLKKESDGDNPVDSVWVGLSEGEGELTIEWTKGQSLVASLVESSDGKGLIVSEVEVSGAGILNQAFEDVGKKLVQGYMDALRKTNEGRLKSVEINEGELVLWY